MTPRDLELIKKRLPVSQSTIRANFGPNRVAPGSVGQSTAGDEPLAENAGGFAYTGRCLIRITSFRRRLCDERNLTDKYFTDALIEAGIAPSDAPKYVKVEVNQEQVRFDYLERTVIIITPCP
jgi:hypothetical protein